MKEGNRLKAQERLNDSNAYKAMGQVQKLMDTYYLDGVIGLLPFGIGDILAALFAVLYVWFAVAKVRSIPLSLAIINNSLRGRCNRFLPQSQPTEHGIGARLCGRRQGCHPRC